MPGEIVWESIYILMDAINVVTIVAGLACTVVITICVQVICIITQKYQKNADCQTHPATPNNKIKLIRLVSLTAYLNVSKEKPPITRGRIRPTVLARRGFLDQFFNAGV